MSDMTRTKRCGLCGLPLNATDTDCGRIGLGHLQRAMQRIHQFNFEPPARQEEHARVTRWAEAMISEGLSLCFAQGETKAEQELSRTSEVLRGIGQYLVSHYIGKIKVNFSFFQGRKYVASVSNVQEQQPGKSSQLFALDLGETAHVVHIAENHLGVVDLVVADLDHVFQAEQVAGIWWRAIYTPWYQTSEPVSSKPLQFLYIVARTSLSSDFMALSNPPHRDPLGWKATLIPSANGTCHLERVL
ncbi:hypothetical protein LB503_006556 [Fusarium chuoi]|nr:hypothetical protein LB503_006556 [Fusarium chuoi]